jgi:hypothetical protein
MHTANRILALAMLLGASACAADVVVDQQAADIEETTPAPVVDEAYEPVSVYVTRCDGLGQLDIALSASDMGAYEGLQVWMSAVEPTSVDSQSAVPVVAAFQEGEVVDGAFALSCNDSLTENYAYPSFTVVIDADDSGDCSAGDIAGTFQGYGWADDQVFDLTAGQDGWVPVQWATVGEGGLVWGEDFCTYYFDDVALEG